MSTDYTAQELMETETGQEMIPKTPTIPVCVTGKVVTEEVTAQSVICGTLQVGASAIEELCPADPYRTLIQITAATGKIALCHSKAQADSVKAAGTNSSAPANLNGGSALATFPVPVRTTARLWLVDLSGSANAASYIVERRIP